ncbi:MAG: hypothetical protein ACRDE5_06335 [Ginsengibacter sp.]
MIEIKDLLNRLNKNLFSEERKREVVRNTISKIIGVGIKSEDVQIKNNIIYLNIKPIYKNEIFIKKEQIFSELQKSTNGKTPDDIR